MKIIQFLKGLLLFIPVTLILSPLTKAFLFISYFNRLVLWVIRNKKKMLFSDFYTPFRNYSKRSQLYEFMVDRYLLANEPVTYLEFGVAAGSSFRWWLNANKHTESLFYGFDTFEGLPEDWGPFYSKGDMSSGIPTLDDSRGTFIKGLFQDTLVGFLDKNREALGEANSRKVIHMDADLYSATAFVLSQLYPFLSKGDIILFDEFSVPLHEFKAFQEFTNNFYIQLTPVGAVNNFYQVAFVVD
ncbi:MAG: class I SAM-dependent methyltransferase [Prevotella sp.]|jgi:hypothetical protein|nr:class I SAM-dependent methyltransferase [Prevotella sp.]